VLYFTDGGYVWNKTLKLFQNNFISHVIRSSVLYLWLTIIGSISYLQLNQPDFNVIIHLVVNEWTLTIVEGATACSEICSVHCRRGSQHGQHSIVTSEVHFLLLMDTLLNFDSHNYILYFQTFDMECIKCAASAVCLEFQL